MFEDFATIEKYWTDDLKPFKYPYSHTILCAGIRSNIVELLQQAVVHGNSTVANRILNRMDIPQELGLKERMAFYSMQV